MCNERSSNIIVRTQTTDHPVEKLRSKACTVCNEKKQPEKQTRVPYLQNTKIDLPSLLRVRVLGS